MMNWSKLEVWSMGFFWGCGFAVGCVVLGVIFIGI